MWQTNLKAFLLSWLSRRFRRWSQTSSSVPVKSHWDEMSRQEKDGNPSQETKQTEDNLSVQQQALTNDRMNDLASPPEDWLARQSAGPPAHWIERVRQGGADQLLEADESLTHLNDGENISSTAPVLRPSQMPQPPPLQLQNIKATEGLSKTETQGEQFRGLPSKKGNYQSLKYSERDLSAQFNSSVEGQNKPQPASQNHRWQWPENKPTPSQKSVGTDFNKNAVHHRETDNNEIKGGSNVSRQVIPKTINREVESQPIGDRNSQNNNARLTFTKAREVKENDTQPKESSANLKASDWQKTFVDEQLGKTSEDQTKSTVRTPGLPKVLFDRSRIHLEDTQYYYPTKKIRQEKISHPATRVNPWVGVDQPAPNYQIASDQWPELLESPDSDLLNEMMNRWRDTRRQQRLDDEQMGISWSE